MSSSRLILNGAGWYIFTARPIMVAEERDTLIYFATARHPRRFHPLTLWAAKSYLVTRVDDNAKYKPLT